MKLSQQEKTRLRELLEAERFDIMQHAQRSSVNEGPNIHNWAVAEATQINLIIKKLNLRRGTK